MSIQFPYKFYPKKSVEWYSVKQLSKTGIKAVISSIFGAFTDKREIQAALHKGDNQLFYDFSDKTDLWIDYVADLGDGFDSTYTVAHFLSQKELTFNVEATKQGNLLLMGGDQVYPTASREEYENRLKGPYNMALPEKDSFPNPPTLFAIPGNHDWYDGLTNFLKIFCQQRKIGAWQTMQTKSYFAIRLSHKVWLLGIDVQLDADIDCNQLAYFEKVKNSMEEGSRVIIFTAEPSWVFTTRRKDHSYKNLSYFEEKCANDAKRDIKQILTLAGDLHHYARYSSGDKHKITSGGGGAFTHPTHNLPETIRGLREGELRLQKTFPSAPESKKLGNRIVKFFLTNLEFSAFMGVFYILAGWLLYLALNKLEITEAIPITFFIFLKSALVALLSSPMLLILCLVVVFGFYGFADKNPANYKYKPWVYHVAGLFHGLLQLLLIFFAYWKLGQLNYILGIDTFPGSLLLLLPELFFVGFILGSTLFGLYLLLSNRLVGMHDNEAFSSLKWTGYKNFIRLHVTKDSITIYPIGIKKSVKWKYDKASQSFQTSSPPPQCHLIENPILINLPPCQTLDYQNQSPRLKENMTLS